MHCSIQYLKDFFTRWRDKNRVFKIFQNLKNFKILDYYYKIFFGRTKNDYTFGTRRIRKKGGEKWKKYQKIYVKKSMVLSKWWLGRVYDLKQISKSWSTILSTQDKKKLKKGAKNIEKKLHHSLWMFRNFLDSYLELVLFLLLSTWCPNKAFVSM